MRKNKKISTKKRLVSAAAMLALSTAMLGSSTYAWFTMSREVEVSNIQMSATVPEDIQISLGRIGTISGGSIVASTKETDASLANGLGSLVNTDGVVSAPAQDWDWSNIADISEYYQFGKLIPASSTDGTNIFFTPNANGVGKTIAAGASFYPANSAILTPGVESSVGGTGSNPLNATAHIINSKSGAYVNDTWSAGGTGNYTTSTAWNDTNDDGYYVDIPVWLRTSSSDGAKLSVLAYVKPKNTDTEAGATAGESLYRAVRVAIIEQTVSGESTTNTSHGLIPVTDGWNLKNGSTAGSLKAAPFALTKDTYNESILNWYGRDVITGASDATALTTVTGAVAGAKAAVSAATPTYDKATVYNVFNTTSDANVVATLAAPATDSNGVKTENYGAATKIIVRVWLEGEDPDCWNETAGQDWSINLKFNNEITNPTTGTSTGGADLPGVNTGVAPTTP